MSLLELHAKHNQIVMKLQFASHKRQIESKSFVNKSPNMSNLITWLADCFNISLCAQLTKNRFCAAEAQTKFTRQADLIGRLSFLQTAPAAV